MTKILYLHGFASSADSTKANQISSFINKEMKKTKILIPDLNNNIKHAHDQIKFIIKQECPTAFMGSSLGGFYGTYFSEKYNLPCVNINPAIPPLDMSEYLGENTNYSTGKKFTIDQKQLDFLNAMSKSIKKIKKPENFMTLVQSGDEVLNYKQALAYYAGSQIDVTYGGNHSFDGFDNYLEKIQVFLNLH